jgi:ATP-dependent DNA helicase DinG
MTFEQMMAAAGLVARPLQSDLALQVAEHLVSSKPIAVAVQAATGVGKTWAMAYAAIAAAAEGRRVIYSTHTTLLRGQVLTTLDRALMAAWPDTRTRPVLAERRGRADFPSASRVLRLRHVLADRGDDRERVELLDSLAGWNGLLADFVAAFGELPAPQTLLCLTASCPAAEQAPYVAQRDAAAAARIVVQTHALTLIEARFGRLAADLVIFDEADTLSGVAAGAVELRLPLAELDTLAELAGVDIERPLAVLRGQAGDAAPIHLRDTATEGAARDIAARLRSAVDPTEPELAEELRDTADDLLRFASVEQRATGAAVLQDRAAGPAIAVAAMDPASWLGPALSDRQTILMSATLGRHEEDDLAAACRRLGFWSVQQVHVTPASFGTMTFRLADRSAPLPFTAGVTADARFFAYAAQMVREAAAGGRTLVLCASYADVDELAAWLPDGTIAQRRGQRLGPLVERFRAEPAGVLVTPAAWAGLDLPYLIDNVVIVRLPVPRPDELREAVLTQALERRGRTGVDARAVLANEARADTMRRLTQGMGRGIRAADEHCMVWIADPRFPLPAAMTADLRRRLTQGAAIGWEELAKAIPLRFREGGVRSAYAKARIVALAPATAAA